MATKHSPKGKKAAPKKEKSGRAKAAKAAPPKPADEEKPEQAEAEGGADDDEDDEDDEMMKAAAKKPLKPSAPKAAQPGGEEQPAVVPARRLTPEAKAKVNQMVAKGMSLTEALKIAATWETFVAPVKDEPAKLVQGRSFEGGGRPRPKPSEDDERREPHDIEDEEPAATEAEE